jgi:oligopeptide/dipeptide ABC transporter ATP-binding protein
MSAPDDTTLALRNVTLHVRSRHDRLKIVDDVSFAIRRGEFFALVGESGSGKTMIAKSIMRLLSDELLEIDGSIMVAGTDVAVAAEPVLRRMRGARMAMIFQEPMSSLNPLMTAGDQIAEALRAHAPAAPRALAGRVRELLGEVQFADPDRIARSYPHELSGGMRQRVMIAIAIANRPLLLIADEPTTALDVTIQKEIMAILAGLARKYALAVLFISHDLSLVYRYADRIGVLYGGVMMELGAARAVIDAPLHPYTAALLGCMPRRRADGRRIAGIEGSVPASGDWTPGCRFAGRCGRAQADCRGHAIPIQTPAQVPERVYRCLHPLTAEALSQ